MKTNFKFKTKLFALAYVLLVVIFIIGCKPDTGYTKRYIDGHKLNLEGGMIKIFSNTSYVGLK